MSSTILVTIDPRGVATVMLNRPDKHNAFNGELIASLHDTLIQLENNTGVRVVVITGAGQSFCAGGDLDHMQRMSTAGEDDNFKDAIAIARCLRKLEELNKPVLARINGNAFGGGVGLICCADIAIASTQARFALSEVRLGIAPAVIAPFVLAAVGQRQMRRMMLTAAAITAEQAVDIGLIHRHIDAQHLDNAVEQEIELLLQGAPGAQQTGKRLIRELSGFSTEQRDTLAARNAKVLAQLRAGTEGREGLLAFVEKRKPDWSR